MLSSHRFWFARSRVAALALLFAVALPAFVLLDVVNRPPPPSTGVLADNARRSQHRVLVLILDGLRFETATNPAIMPRMNALRATGVSGRIETVFEGFSIPAIQAAFSGRAETQLLNLVRNFRVRALPIESVFQDLSHTGGTAVVVGSEAFEQFGPYLERRVPPRERGDMYDQDAMRPAMALAAYAREPFDLVVCHVNTTDWVAHEFGIHGAGYRAGFGRADSIVADFAAARRPGDYVLVFGDHGHNEVGEHKTGMDIPTFGLFIGPTARPGRTFASIPISDLRLVLSHALGLPLRGGAYHVDVLGPLFTDSLRDASLDDAATAGAPIHRASRAPGEYVLAVAVLVLFAGIARAVLPPRATSDAKPATASRVAYAAVGLAVALELAAQRLVHPAWTIFPFLMIGLGFAMLRRNQVAGACTMAVGTFFLSRLLMGDAGATLPLVPTGPAAIVPLYVASFATKIAVLAWIAGRRRWPLAVLLGGALGALGFRVLDHPALFLGAIAVAATWLALARERSTRRLAAVVLGWCILYFTHRLPLFQYAWIDIFLAAFVLVHRTRRGLAVDALALTGTFALTSGWLVGGIEWGFLYSTFPAYAVEFQVAWFAPLIVLMLPILLVILWCVVAERPSRDVVAIALLYVWVRLAAAWGVRLLGGRGEDVWPMAEQGGYLLVFAAAALWASRGAHRVTAAGTTGASAGLTAA